ncbi:MAG: molybdopterin-guanine dinucleotide biosynthesis protein B [Candidatus Bathyarchaeota archaeon]|nr:molybdopterin-guanine dinucleotide biosynthesis protein B [Candidatus Bathyarchaeota archaeon]
MVLAVAAVGVSGSGKTTTLEYLTGRFSSEGYRIGAIKHIHHQGFTIDTAGTNTYRYAQAGAKIVAAISPNEIDIIKKSQMELNNLDQVLSLLEKEDLDIIFIEGFHGLIKNRGDIPKIVTAKDQTGLEQALQETEPPVLAISGIVALHANHPSFEGTPFVAIPADGDKLVEMIKNQLQKR